MNTASTHTIRTAVVGATGYAGAELMAILARHDGVEATTAFAGDNSKAVPVSAIHPSLSGQPGKAEPFTYDALTDAQPDLVFLATPNETSAELAPRLLADGFRVIDLSGAFRLHDASLYPGWYGFTHDDPSYLGEAVYGLTEWCNGELKKARLVANPGCYPTSILLALRPLTYLIDREQPVIIDAKSGVSGAGKKADVAWSFAELSGNCKAYGVGQHRHTPELRQELHLGDRATLVFVPHLLPTVRGILSTMHVAFSEPVTDEELVNIYADAYDKAPLVHVLPPGQLPELRRVVNTPRAEIGFQLLQGGRRAVVVSVIDNLLKGAASQAVQNCNRMFGFAETEGIQ